MFKIYRLEEHTAKYKIFDQTYGSLMLENEEYKKLLREQWDTYRDLNKILQDDFCMENEFFTDNCLLIDSDPLKM